MNTFTQWIKPAPLSKLILESTVRHTLKSLWLATAESRAVACHGMVVESIAKKTQHVLKPLWLAAAESRAVACHGAVGQSPSCGHSFKI